MFDFSNKVTDFSGSRQQVNSGSWSDSAEWNPDSGQYFIESEIELGFYERYDVSNYFYSEVLRLSR